MVDEYDAIMAYNGITKAFAVVLLDTTNLLLLCRSVLRDFRFVSFRLLCQVNEIELQKDYRYTIDQIKTQFSQAFTGQLRTCNSTRITVNSDWVTPLVPWYLERKWTHLHMQWL